MGRDGIVTGLTITELKSNSVMATIDVRAFEDTLIVHFGTDQPRVNAYTLATTLISIADAAKAANAAVNPGYEVEVVVEALGAGSFKATVRSVYRGVSNLFSRDNLKAIALGVVASFVYQHTLAPDQQVMVNVNEDEVIIEQGGNKIIIPRAVHEALRQVDRDTAFRDSIYNVARAVEKDPDVRSIGFGSDSNEPVPPVQIPRDRLLALPKEADALEPEVREKEEVTNIEIVRAILERSRRRWEFVWHGVRISAPVTDAKFYDDFFAHRIKIAPGDSLNVRLRIKQRRSPDIGVYVNESYEVVEVLSHVPRPAQAGLYFELG